VLIEIGIVALLGSGWLTAATTIDSGRIPRPLYGALISWWYGGFAADTVATRSALMLDSDRNCDAWENVYGSDNELFNKTLGLKVWSPCTHGKCTVAIKSKDDKWINVPVTSYDDYLISKSIERWNERKKALALYKTHSEAAGLLEHRINLAYVDTIEMIDKRILNSGADTADELRAMLTPPEHPDEKRAREAKEEEDRLQKLCNKYDPIYDPYAKKNKVVKKSTKPTQSVAPKKRQNSKSISSKKNSDFYPSYMLDY
jgi:hypothetical protein